MLVVLFLCKLILFCRSSYW